MTERERPAEQLPRTVHAWPYLVRLEVLAAVATLLAVLVWSIVADAPLQQAANPGITPNPAKAPWYFLGLQELLVYFDPWIAGVAIPALILFGLAAIPYLDVNPRGNGYYTLRERPFAVSVFLFGFSLWFVLIAVGVFLRGPGWGFFPPWVPWDPLRVESVANVDLFGALERRSAAAGAVAGGLALGAYFVVPPLVVRAWLRRHRPDAIARLAGWRYAIVAFLLLCMTLLPVKMVLRWLFHVKYVWVLPGVFNV
ncbi:MAG TPA: hypothetical protein VF841_15775 [Anaeromyxobacter sp.]